MRDPEARAALDLRQQAPRIDDRPDVADGQKIDERRLPGFDVDLHFGEPDHERVGDAVARMVVLGHAHQPEPGERRRRRARHRIDVLGQLVTVEPAAELDGPPRRLRVAQSTSGTAAPVHALAANLVVVRASRRDRARQSPAACAGRPSRPHSWRASSRASSGCRPRDTSRADACRCRPRRLPPSPTACRALRPRRARDRSLNACPDCRRPTGRRAGRRDGSS